MNMMTSIRPDMGGPLMPHVSRPVVDRLQALLVAIGALIDTGAARKNPLLGGCAVAPFAGFVTTGTTCRRPLLFPEVQQIAEQTGFDALLLRFDVDRGTSFDLTLEEGERRLCRYVAWRRRGGDPWLIPTAGDGPFIQATAWGLECRDTPPFHSCTEREAGIIRAIHNPSFAGRL
jgi:hypothetical protein